MVTRVIKSVFDDLTGEEGASTHVIDVDGYRWEIDLVDSNFEDLMESIRRFTDAGRRVATGKRTAKAKAPASTGLSWLDPGGTTPGRTVLPPSAPAREIRKWWKANVGKVKGLPPLVANGRVPQVVMDAWTAHHPAADHG